MIDNPEIKLGANVIMGRITYQGVANAFGLECTSIDNILRD
jgi:alanine dehydrogenase